MADFDLSVEELRLVACFVADAAEPLIAQAAEPLIPGYETARPDDPRPGAAVAAARAFVAGAPRSRWQRLASMDAHRAAAESGTESARRRAEPGLVDVLRRYPPHTSASNRVAQLISALDSALRSR
ncbi:hypothetical protein QWI29_17255 [Mycolicibacterium neoaurum]|uniref:putative immunity protein n=1 Tax=Mycolicibacterium neoaurum TaxID=1795 RepID=UPI0026733ADF|nr:hypothetical protein [Mycolicibacterium neoaurum]MDO3401792.1 hypothetical protein [Mycolicibacterium neoaurum]